MRKIVIPLLISALPWLSARALDPPRDLKWDMSYSEVETTFETLTEDEKGKVHKLGEKNEAKGLFPSYDLPEGFRSARLSDIKLLDKKIDDGFAVFDDSSRLVEIQYQWSFVYGGQDEKAAAACWAESKACLWLVGRADPQTAW